MLARRGLSITEVLIAIFIMAIGMISLLALFPIGMIRMSQAIRNNRIANAAMNAQAMMELQSLRSPDVNAQFSLYRGDPELIRAIRNEPTLWDGSNYLFPTNTYTTGTVAHSCPVFVDPIGSSLWGHVPAISPSTSGDPVGRGSATLDPNGSILRANIGIPRSFSSQAPFNANRSVFYRWYTLEDEVTFTASGLAVAGPVERERRISWAYLWRRPVWQEEGVVDVSLVLYSNRMIAGLGNAGGTTSTDNIFRQEFKAGGPAGTLNGVAWNSRVFIKNSRRAALNWNGAQNAQPVQPGYWILDATMLDNNSPLGDGQWHLNGFFYQIVNVGDLDATGQQEIELDRPAREDGYVGVIPLGIVDVIEKNDGRRP